MKYTLLILMSFLLVLPVVGADKIEGAFGLKLGDVFSPTGIEGEAKQSVSDNRYQFTPEKPNKVFSEYFVVVTPTTHRIYRIIAIARWPDGNEGYKVSEAIAALLNRKYGETSKLIGQVVQNNRVVGMSNDSSGPEGVTFHVTYEDSDIARQAEVERIEKALKNVDTTGL